MAEYGPLRTNMYGIPARTASGVFDRKALSQWEAILT